MLNKVLITASLAIAVLATPATAVTVVGSQAVAIVGISSDMPSIGIGTTFTNSLFTIVGSATGDLSSTASSFITISPLKALAGEAFSFTSAFGNFAGTVQTAFTDGVSTNRTVGAYIIGLFTPLGTLSEFEAAAASVTFSFTQTGTSGATSGSYSFSSPPTPLGVVPEPALWATLIAGFGLVGAAARRRRLQSVTA